MCVLYNECMETNEDIFKLIKILTRSVVNGSKMQIRRLIDIENEKTL